MLFNEFIKIAKGEHLLNLDLFCDIETFQFNQEAGRKKPSLYKNQVFSVAVAFIYRGIIHTDMFPNFKEFFDVIEDAQLTVKTKIKLWFHNGNKYDNHFLLYQLLNDNEDIKRYPEYIRQSEDNTFTETFKTLHKHKGDKIILEKRVKSSTNLALHFTLGTVTYETVDSLAKTTRSLKSLGITMTKLGLMDEAYQKTDFDYLKYNTDEDMSYQHSYSVAFNIFKHLTDSERLYIRNDVIILAYVFINYSKIFKGFDIDKITFSQNILDEYKVNALATFQLTAKYDPFYTKYTDYDFRGENFYDYLKKFYKGGLNFYNDQYIGKIINREIKSFDRNSSYPHVMYSCKIPTFLIKTSDVAETYTLSPYVDNIFEMFEVTLDEFNRLIGLIDSKNIRKALVKYYSTYHENVYINTNTIQLIKKFTARSLEKIHVLSRVKWQCEYFGARDVLADNYFKKTQGKSPVKLIMHDPTNFETTTEKNPYVFEPAEIDTAKVINNGIYGLPALRSHYNLSKYNPHNDTLESLPATFKNTERNMIFSIFVTSMAFYKLLEPLSDLDSYEIDKYWYYADTDSLYIDSAVADKIDNKYMDELNLGQWKNEHIISNMVVLNHKKYAFVDNGKIHLRAGGIRRETFNTDMPFYDFVQTQFSGGVEIKNNKSFLTKAGTIAIYPSATVLDYGTPYPLEMSYLQKRVLKMFKEKAFNEAVNDDPDEALFIDTPFGTLSMTEVVAKPMAITGREVSNLIYSHNSIKYLLTERHDMLKSYQGGK